MSFAEVIGQEHIVRALTNALSMNKIGHAYLFCGPRGVGKTTLARLLAKSINCQKRQLGEFEPCNQCPSCIAINQGRALDLIEIDAASHRGIDEIRELRDGIKFSPTQTKYKVFIIDEAHMLTREAFNALLKTLEEPPEHAFFILVTTEAHKMLPTIISRCQRFDFKKIPLDKIKQSLKDIVKKEEFSIEEPALHLISQAANGYLRDGQSILAKVLTLAEKNKKISTTEVQSLLGLPDYQTVIQFVDYLGTTQVKQAILQINELMNQGYDLSQFAKLLISWLRQMAVLKIDPSLKNLAAADLTDDQYNVIVKQTSKMTLPKILQAIELFSQAEQKIKMSFLPQMPLEIATIEFTSHSNVGDPPLGGDFV